MGRITSRDIVRAMARDIKFMSKYRTFGFNVFSEDGRYEMDFVGVRANGYCDEVEVKVSRSDFFADSKKMIRGRSKHERLKAGELLAKSFYFAVPEGLVSEKEVPEWAGLIEFRDGLRGLSLKIKKKAPALHRRKITPDQEFSILRSVNYKYLRQVANIE